MIEVRHGNLFDADADALVNAVNCVGVMGKGIALAFKKAFPANFAAYAAACARGELSPGLVLVHDGGRPGTGRFVINFPTKRHWKDASRLADIDAGLPALVAEVQKHNIASIAVPALGCGLGGLDWAVVCPRIEAAFAAVPDVRVLLYEPGDAAVPAARASTGAAGRRCPRGV